MLLRTRSDAVEAFVLAYFLAALTVANELLTHHLSRSIGTIRLVPNDRSSMPMLGIVEL